MKQFNFTISNKNKFAGVKQLFRQIFLALLQPSIPGQNPVHLKQHKYV